MNSDKYNNNPSAKNYSNCDISGSFYSVTAATATAPTATAPTATAEPNYPSGQEQQCPCVGTCAKPKKSS